jgi:hypothetical protein
MTLITDRAELASLAQSFDGKQCSDCQALSCIGWESIPGSFTTKSLEQVATLRPEDAAECWDEDHPNGTNFWSEAAPISMGFHPYNKSDVYKCKQCGCLYLRYTECGGYYVDERIRLLDPKLIS